MVSAPSLSRVTTATSALLRCSTVSISIYYFEKDWPHLDDAQRRILVEGNKEILGALMQKKCEAREWQDEKQPGGKVKKITISRADLFGVVPRLSDARLKVFQGAGFQNR
jgi:hypothetical protein